MSIVIKCDQCKIVTEFKSYMEMQASHPEDHPWIAFCVGHDFCSIDCQQQYIKDNYVEQNYIP